MSKKSDYLLGVEIFCLCKKKMCSIEEITKKLYNNQNDKNIVRVYRAVTEMMKHEILRPKLSNNYLYFFVNENKTKE